MAESFDALGHRVLLALSHDAEHHGDVLPDTSQVHTLLAERDALLVQLTAALADTGSPLPADSISPVLTALSTASASTDALISKVADRTDALRVALRDMSRSVRVTDAYQSSGAQEGLINARR